jgi:transposase-like protein
MDTTKDVVVRQNGSLQIPFSGDPLSEGIRARIRGFIEEMMNEELDAVLGAGRYERTEGRRGHRNGSKPRTLTTSMGKTTFDRPRAVLYEGKKEVEYVSSIVDRYRRRSREVDAALLGMYFGGVNTRKVKRAIRPLLKDAPLSKSAVSRLIQRLKEYFEAWRTMSLKELSIAYLYLDGIYVRVRCGGKTRSLPVLAAVGIQPDGEKILLALEVRGGESEAAWKGVLDSLIGRGLGAPKLLITDGGIGLTNALDLTWREVPRQRCAVHKLRNLLSHAPEAMHEEIRVDFHAIVYAEEAATAKTAYDAFLRKWRRLSEGVARSLEEGGAELMTFFRFPKSQWKAIRTTNVIERLNQEFRRRIKTQVCFPTESSVLIVLFGLVASGMVRMRKIDGYEDMVEARIVERGASSCVPQTPMIPDLREKAEQAATMAVSV